MAAFRSATSTTYASRSNTTLTAPTGIQNGDVLVLVCLLGAASPPTPTPPTGFTALSGFPSSVSDGSFVVRTYAWYKVANNESGNYRVSHASASSQGYICAVSGADTSNPIGPAPTIATGTGTTATAPGLTTLSDGSLVIYLGHDWGNTSNNLVPPAGNTPTFTERMDVSIMYVADGVMSTSGATGNKSHTINNDSSGVPWMASLIAIRGTGTVTPTPATSVGAQAQNSVTSSNTISCTLTDVQAGSTIAVVVDYAVGVTLNSVRSNGTSTFSQIPHSPLNTGFGAYCSIHYLSNVGAGTHTITASLSSSNHVTMFATEIIGAAASDVVRADNTGSGTSVNITGANVAVSAGDFLFGVILCGGTVVSVGSPYSSDSTEHQVIWAANVSAGTYGLSYVQDSSQPWAGLLAAFKAAPIGGTVHGLSGIAAGISATSAALNARRALGGSVLGQGATSAFLSRSLHLTGATSGTSSTRAMATAIRRMSGLSVGHSAASATVTMRRSLSGTTSGLSEASAKLSISRALQGIAAGTSAVIGTLAGTVQLIALSGITAGKAVCSGALSVARRLSGTAVGQSTTTGKLSALRGFSAITRGTSASIGRLSAIRGMLGAAIGTASLQAHLSITRVLQAISAGIGTLIGQLSSVIPFIPVEPDFTIPAESRTLHVIGESRTFQAGQEDRTFHV